MAVREGAALGVLAGEPDRDALAQSSEAKASASAWPQSMPPSSSARGRRSSCRWSFGLTVKPSGTRASCSVSRRSRLRLTTVSTYVFASRGTASSCDFAGISWPNEARSRSCASCSRASTSATIALGLVGGEDALLDEPRAVELADGGMRVDLPRHDRLGIGGLVLLVVAEAAVADEVDDDVVAEAGAIGEREPDRGDRGLGIVGVDVDDRRVEALREVGGMAGRAALGGVGRETDLVIRDHVQRAARRVALERVEVEGLGDDALPRERRVAVQEHRHRRPRVVGAVTRAAVGLHGARHPLDDGVDRLEMARVGGQRDGDLPVRGRADALGARGGT